MEEETVLTGRSRILGCT